MRDQGLRRGSLLRAVLLGTGFACFAVGAGYLAVRAIDGWDLVAPLFDPGPGAAAVFPRPVEDALPWVLLATIGGLLLAAGGLLSFLRARQLEAGEAERDQLRDTIAEREDELRRSREQIRGLEKARTVEREWNRKLRRQISELHRAHGALGDFDDLPALVLRMAIELLDAEKGILIAGEPGDEESELRVRSAYGFDSDPSESHVAKHFASEVLERDVTIRQGADELDNADSTPADREIENLIAIPIYVQDEFSGAVVCVNSEGYRDHDEEVLVALGDHAGTALENTSLHNQLRTTYLATVRMLTEAIEAKDPFLRTHSEEVFGHVSRVADRLGIETSSREQLLFASLLHDVGKIGISERILLKPGPLSPEEFGIIKLHPRIGSQLIENVPLLRPMSGAILHHHERFDGDGYPSGLSGEEIPIEARLIGVADAYSAMTSERPYRGRMSLEAACEELERCAGSQFDPVVVSAFVEEVRKDAGEPSAEGLADMLKDPEIDARLEEEEPLLGYGAYAVIDNLTLLYSRRYLHERAAAEAARASLQEDGFALCLIELTDLKALNRREGFAAGDRLLQSAGQILQREAVRCGGTACRFGGSTFALLIPHGDQASASSAGEAIAEALSSDIEARFAAVEWSPRESGDEVVDRAAADLAGQTGMLID